MKRRIGTIKDKVIVEGGGTNLLTSNEVLIENNKIITRENGKLKELGNSNSSDSKNSNTTNLVTDFALGNLVWDSSYTYQEYQISNDLNPFFKKDESTGIWTFDYKNATYAFNGAHICGYILNLLHSKNIIYISENTYTDSSDVESNAISILNNKYIYLKPAILREDLSYDFYPSSINQLIPIKLV